MSFDYLTLLVYHPRKTTPNGRKSKSFIGGVKAGRPEFTKHLVNKLKELDQEGDFNLLQYFENSVLVPTPRSAPIIVGGVYPTKTIADGFVSENIGSSVHVILKRTYAIPTSSSQSNADSRNSVEDHLRSLEVTPAIITEPNIILMDDILTLGRTAMASCMKLREVYPDKNIKVFCPFRTRGFANQEDILIDPRFGQMELTSSGKVWMPD